MLNFVMSLSTRLSSTIQLSRDATCPPSSSVSLFEIPSSCNSILCVNFTLTFRLFRHLRTETISLFHLNVDPARMDVQQSRDDD